MFTHIDWMSFTFHYDNRELENDLEARPRVMDELSYQLGGLDDLLSGVGEWTREKGRKPYSSSIVSADKGVRIFWHHKLDHFLIEISGTGCERIFSDEQGKQLLHAVRGRLTRLDVAVDMASPANPIDFAEKRSGGRFKSYQEVVSESGTTYYVGSQTSNRFARVYRYSEPHPRAHLLRAEHVFRAEDAKEMANSILFHGMETAAEQCRLIYGWEHDAWTKQVDEVEKLSAHRANREDAKTVYWLYDTVAPLIARLHNEGTLDLAKFLKEAVVPHLKSNE